MAQNTISIESVSPQQLPGRSVRVLSDALPIRNLTFGICEVPPRSEMQPHSHVQEEVIFILEGHGVVSIDGVVEKVEPGTLAHFASGAEHYTANEDEIVMRFAFCFSPPVVVGSYDRGK